MAPARCFLTLDSENALAVEAPKTQEWCSRPRRHGNSVKFKNCPRQRSLASRPWWHRALTKCTAECFNHEL
eukprot:7303380-Pyramimonas_sp.AAC.1